MRVKGRFLSSSDVTTLNIFPSSSLQSFLELCFQGTLNLFCPTKNSPGYWPVSTCSISQVANWGLGGLKSGNKLLLSCVQPSMANRGNKAQQSIFLGKNSYWPNGG